MRLFFFLLLFSVNVSGQTFNGGGGVINDFQTLEIPILVNVPQSSIDTVNFGLETVCLNLNHTYLADLTIEVQAPDGTTRMLMSGIGGGEDNLVNTCFNQDASNPIQSGSAPFSGTFVPMGQIGAVNNGQNPNGIWKIKVRDDYAADIGNVINCSLTFGSNPATYFAFKESNLPIVVIETNGLAIGYDIKTVADMGIIYNGPGNRNYLVNPFNEYNGKIGIEYRGNYSLSLPQKPYSIELIDTLGNSIDSSILDMPAENDWLLLANYNDKSFARNSLPFQLFDSMGHYGVRSRHVDVVLNGEYQGIYLLAEKIKRDSNRVDIAKLDSLETFGLDLTGGYIIKIDYWDNSNSWQSNFSPIGFPGLDVHFVYYYPKPEDIVPEQKTYIQNFMNDFETALYGPNFDDPVNGYRKYISVRSFIDYFIINELARNVDGYKKSRFLFKDKDNLDGTYGKLRSGPVWDFDWALKDMWSGSEDGSQFMYGEVDQDVNAPGWYIRLLQDSTFRNELRCRYEDLRRSLLDETYLHQQIDSIAAVVSESQNWHYQIWGNMGVATGTFEVQAPSQTYAEEVQRLKDWISRRLVWLDDNIPGTLNGCSMTSTDDLAFTNVEVFPNPFRDQIEIRFEGSALVDNCSILLIDASGRTIQNEVFTAQPNLNSIILENLNSLNSGLYFIELKVGDNTKVFKVTK
jgi:subtilisin-like proprotein convertase family protein